MSELAEGELLVRGKDKEVVRYVLHGKQGYSLMKELRLIRVWSENSTHIVHLDELISLALANESRSE